MKAKKLMALMLGVTMLAAAVTGCGGQGDGGSAGAGDAAGAGAEGGASSDLRAHWWITPLDLKGAC